MKFNLIDRVLAFESGASAVAVKAVSRSEEYLADHFPTFPVLPGVFLLQVLVETGSWLVRASHGFSESVVLLHEARNVTYKSFVQPGEILRAEVTCRHMERASSEFAGSGRCGETEVVKARFSLRHFNLSEHEAALAATDQRLCQSARAQWSLLYRQG